MKHSVFAAIGSPTIRSHRSFGIATCALPSILMLMLSLSFAAGQVWPQCGLLSAPSTTWNDGNGSGVLRVTGRVALPPVSQTPASWMAQVRSQWTRRDMLTACSLPAAMS
jgi:hypothetical protein